MKQRHTIEILKNLFSKLDGLNAALLYGSFARGNANTNSDIDIKLLVENDFVKTALQDELSKIFQDEIIIILNVTLRNKLVVYLRDHPKLEFAFCSEITEIERDIRGSEMSSIENVILFQNKNYTVDLDVELNRIISLGSNSSDQEKRVTDLVDKFLYEFESCSSMHGRSDGYQFYFFYNIALHVAIQLQQLSRGNEKFNFLPKNLIVNGLSKEELKAFYALNGILFLPEANKQKRKLLDFFYPSIAKLLSKEKAQVITQFCEEIYERDYFWNFRDIASNNAKLKSGLIFRTATLSMFQSDKRFQELLSNKGIKTIIDLRADREIAELPYHPESLTSINYIQTQFDPWNQPDWFKKEHHYGTNEEIAYRYFVIGCQDKIKEIMMAILNEKEGAVAIHCFAGKDRTGIVITLLHLLTNTPLDIVFVDYLASESDVLPYRLQLVLDLISELGGIEKYLFQCGLKENQIQNLRTKLLQG
jgi:protein tyrosine/serine phosphatase/predicted nucleotidyltransferase